MGMTQQNRAARVAVTIIDVANAAGVSRSTVSRVLDERLPRSDNETARRVRQAAQDLGYQRDLSASNLRRGTTMTVGVVVPRLTDTVMAMFYEAVSRAAEQRGQFAIVATTDDDPAKDRKAVEALLQRRVDGLVLTTARDDDGIPAWLESRGVHYVLALRTDGHSPSSIGDDHLGGYLATRHLLDLGHRRIGVIAGPQYASSARGRVAGFRAALDEVGVEVQPSLIVESTFGIEAGELAAENLLDLDRPPTAIFAVNDNTAIGALSTIRRRGLSVPDQVSVVGYNDIPIVSRLPVPLTTVRVPFDQIAGAALDLLGETVTTATPRTRITAPTLIPRASTAGPP